MSKTTYYIDGLAYQEYAGQTNNITGDKKVYLRRIDDINREEVATVTAADCSPKVFDMLSSLSQHVAQLKRELSSVTDQLDSVVRNQVKQAEEIHSFNVKSIGITVAEAIEALSKLRDEVLRNGGN